MNDFLPMKDAPRDGAPIQARIPGHGSDNIIAFHDGFIDSDENDVGAWVFVTDQEPPDCWTDGVCWQFNEDGKQSVQPNGWKPLPGGDMPKLLPDYSTD